ncbi:MAG: 2-oxo acid dehydrogenase subunit E2, partial [Bacteroidales bacterium]|nr:2-oxo acid dehydrogenase subunit E2 [Bacteroidales bacterium]
MNKGYKSTPLTFNRQAVRASASVTRQKNTIHGFTEVDISEPRRIMKEHYEKTGEKLSLTAYIVTCLARVLQEYPQFNSFIRRRRLILLDDVTVSVLVERELSGETVPEPFAIKQAQLKTFHQIQDELKEARKQPGNR